MIGDGRSFSGGLISEVKADVVIVARSHGGGGRRRCYGSDLWRGLLTRCWLSTGGSLFGRRLCWF
jgi:hypothetical protein